MTGAKNIYVNRVKAIIFDRKERARKQAEEQENRRKRRETMEVSNTFHLFI